MNILSIQSHVAYGHVGNAAAVFPLQRMGHEVWPIHTVQFSNHTGYGAWRGQVFDAGLIADCVLGLDERGALARCDGVLSGYMGSADTGTAILDALARVRAASPAALYCCDPVIGDTDTGVFVRPGIADFMRERALPAADVLTPNQFELDLLCGGESRSAAGLARALSGLHARGPRAVLVTSHLGETTPADALDLVASGDGGAWRVRTPRLPLSVNGAGDAVAALFFARYLEEGSVPGALAHAASAVFGLLSATLEAGTRELALVAAQDEFVRPSRAFAPEPV
ncbi:pyridoxal kinase PdxY [Lichenibacterium dinghuense]|uniref:pyridoxal kinase PdxY n=1 Tax=Lichenibacterium dinghuense TaxID=2895977 RepID=UPI001F01118E|nr:pyridoxal kinase PdxY [Lichenibacterium sp. 6Y81]